MSIPIGVRLVKIDSEIFDLIDDSLVSLDWNNR